MRVVFLYGPVAAGKLTIGRLLAHRTGFALFHNHLIVDAVGAVFPFGSAEFVALRERFWLDTFAAAARSGRSLIFTFAPEPTVAADFPARAVDRIRRSGGEVVMVELAIDRATQAARIANADRAAFGKLRSPELLAELRPGMDASLSAMTKPALTIDTGAMAAQAASDRIAAFLGH